MINEALRLIRVYHDLKQYELADKIGISKSHISELEKGVKTPTLEIIDRYANEFKVSSSSILFFAEKLPDAKHGNAELIRANIASKIIKILSFVEAKSNE